MKHLRPFPVQSNHQGDHPLHPTARMLPLFRYGVICALFWTVIVGTFALWSMRELHSHLNDLALQKARTAFATKLLSHRSSPPLARKDGATTSSTEETDTATRLTALGAKAPHAPDQWEAAALRRFAQGENEASGQIELGGTSYLRLIRPLLQDETCRGCHRDTATDNGDVRGGITVLVPLQPLFDAQIHHRHEVLFWIGSIWLIGLAMMAAGFSHMRHEELARLATESALRDSEEEFRLLAENANDLIWTMDLDGRFTYVSPSVERQLGYSREEVLRFTFDQLLSPVSLASVRPRLNEAITEIAAGERITGTRLEIEKTRKDGSTAWFDVTFTAIYNDAGHFLGFMGVSRNISARKRTEEALRISEEKYRSIFESFQDLYYRTDMNGLITEITPSILPMGGYTQEEVLGKAVTTFYADAADRQEMLKRLKAQGELNDYETKLKRKDGRVVDASLNARILFNAGGRAIGVEGILRDISERKLAEARLRDLSLKDELTGLNNRRGFVTLAEQQMKTVGRKRQFVALIYADLDGMKWINDTLGHKEGDRALVDAAGIIRRSFRDSDIVARLGGDEFVGLAVLSGKEDGELLLVRLRDGLTLHNEEAGRTYPLSISFGMAIYDPAAPCSLMDLMVRGDEIMYEQKQRRKSSRGSRPGGGTSAEAAVPAPSAATGSMVPSAAIVGAVPSADATVPAPPADAMDTAAPAEPVSPAPSVRRPVTTASPRPTDGSGQNDLPPSGVSTEIPRKKPLVTVVD
ncbi:PAS domain S-box protein [Geomonas sp. Red32]|uniref:PAS domain S-box protein n=1 Tax=Geomonas sp. Red32 TaxID=2912856 RepID=UPI00202D06F1|nr:PAS domain S-box protein [Geomonas sp. Red32]MCM0082155.1 PAS domain S-box protein [Geomonas sp. Red32]